MPVRLGIGLGVLSFAVSFGFGVAAGGRSSEASAEALVTAGAAPRVVRATEEVAAAEGLEEAPAAHPGEVLPEVVRIGEQRVRLAARRTAEPVAARHAPGPAAADDQVEELASSASASAPDPDPDARPGTVAERAVRDLHGLLPDLDATDVRAVVGGQRARMQQCYTRALRRAGRAQDAAVRLTVDIAPEGNVSAASVEGADLANLGECLEALAARWSFPRSRGGARVPIPLAFTSGD